MKIINDKIGKINDKWFFFAILYLVVDYGRPQDLLHIGFMRPGMVCVLILTFFLFSNKGFLISKSRQTNIIWCFAILTAVYIPFAVNTFYAYHTTRIMLLYIPFILSIVVCVNCIERLRKMITVFTALMIYISAYSLLHGGHGSGGWFTDENDVSLFINMWLPFCFFLILNEKGIARKIFYAVGLVTGLMAIINSFSRGGFIGLVCMVFVIWLVSPKKLITLALICAIGFAVYTYSGEAYKNEMSTVTDTNEATAQGRLLAWRAAWDMFVDNPLGVGGNNFQIRFPEYQSAEFKRGMWGRVAHSLWFTLLPELGIVGVILYLSLLYYNLKDIFYLRKIRFDNNSDLRYLHTLSLAFIASLAGFFASATFISVLYYPHYWYMTALIVATARIYKTYLVNSELEMQNKSPE